MYDTYPASILPTSRVRTDNEAHSTEALKDFISDSQLLLDIFTFNSFALNMTITEVKGNEQKSKSSNKPKSTEIVSSAPSVYAVIRSQFPANLWSQQSLRLRKDTPTNDYDIKMLASFARKCNIAFEWLSTTVQNDIDVAHMIRIS